MYKNDPITILQLAFTTNNHTKQNTLVKEALAENFDINELDIPYYNANNISIESFEAILDKGLSTKKILECLFQIKDHFKQKFVINMLLAKRDVDLENIFIPSDNNLSLEFLQYLLEKGLPSNKILQTALYMTNEVNQKEWVDFALSRHANLENIFIPSVNNLSLEFLQYLLEKGLPSNEILQTALYMTNEVNQKEWVDFALSRHANLENIFIPSNNNLSLEFLQYLLEKGLPSNKIIPLITDENQLELLDLATNYKISFRKIHALPKHLNQTHIDKIIQNGTSPSKLLELALKQEDSIKFVDYLIKKGATFDNIIEVTCDLSYETYLLLIKKGLNPDALIQGVFSKLELFNNTEKFIEYINFALSNGANLNADYGKGSILNEATNLEIANFLIEKGASCSIDLESQQILENNVVEIIIKPNYALNMQQKNLFAPISQEAKIPHLLHHIWLTSKDNPKEIRPQDLDNLLKTHATFLKSSSQWKQTLWTNDKNLIPQSVKALEAAGIEVKSIYDYKEDIASFELIEELIHQQKWGMASDALRYSLVYEFGGVYSDINFIFNRDSTEETYRYNFFTQQYEEAYIDNFFFGASPKHPILEDVINQVVINLINPPEYTKSIIDENSPKKTDFLTANPLSIAYYKQANKNDNIDVVYPDSNQHFSEDNSRFTEKNTTFFDACNFSIVVDFSPLEPMCYLERFTIGKDSIDGKTWIIE